MVKENLPKVYEADKKSGKKRRSILALLGGGALVGVGSAATQLMDFTETINVSYGETTFQNSSVDITDVTLKGPGINVDTVEVTADNTSSSSITFDLSAYLNLYDGSTVSGSSTGLTISGDATGKTYSVSVSKTKEIDIDTTDVKVKEQ